MFAISYPVPHHLAYVHGHAAQVLHVGRPLGLNIVAQMQPGVQYVVDADVNVYRYLDAHEVFRWQLIRTRRDCS